MARVYLHKTHPGLFYWILAIALTHFSVGGLMLYALLYTPASTHSNPGLGMAFIAAFFVAGSLQLYGILAPHYRYIRGGLIMGLALISFLALTFTLSVGLKLGELQIKQLAWLIPPWPLWAFSHYLALGEPVDIIQEEGNVE